ncbi:MAG: methyltransferase domain-containing protein [Tepidisphaeraceae bacterium]|jgi:hypothetical protein
MANTPTLVPRPAPVDPPFSNPAEFDEAWKARIAHLAEFVDTSGPVMDIGCGMMWLEPLLVRGNRYIPVDYVRRDHRTLLVDLNAQPLPEVEAEFAFMSGVLEYVHDVPRFLRQVMARRFRRILLSYCTLECWWKMPLRRSLNWVSHESLEDLLNVLLTEYTIVALERFQQHVALVVELREP